MIFASLLPGCNVVWPRFEDRTEAGRILASVLTGYIGREDLIVLGLPRGGVPVAYEVALLLKAPLDVFIARKLGVPGQEELAFGAIASGDVMVLNEELVSLLRLNESTIDKIREAEIAELERRETLYRAGRPRLEVRGRTVIVVDDGLATGATMHAAVKALKKQHPKEVVVAVPVAASQICDEFKEEADVVAVCAITPEPFFGVGIWYQDFSQTTDDEVRELLAAASDIPKPRDPLAARG
jgi:predicted phosphoribosyltransferase